jgi:zinc transporter ZupT
MNPSIYALPFISTFAGGLAGLHLKDRLHLILGFTAGVLLGVVAFDVLPEIFHLAAKSSIDIMYPMVALVIGFLLFHTFEKLLLIHHAEEDAYSDHSHTHPTVGVASALALAGHSFLDGVGIGLAFQISTVAGVAVAVAVVAHDFSDGLNTVSLALLHHNSDRRALKLLAIDAIAPVLGGLSTMFYTLPDRALLIYLGFFAGFLLYIGASDILPQAHATHSSYKTIALTVTGTLCIYLVTRFI